MSLREKSAWISLVISLFVFVPYFARLFGAIRQGDLPDLGILGPFLGAAAVQVALIVIGEIVAALSTRDEPADERDRAIDARANRYGYHVLSATCGLALVAMVVAMVGSLAVEVTPTVALATASQAVFFCLVLAEAVRNTLQVVGYRRGA